jgi:hypothetical protein
MSRLLDKFTKTIKKLDNYYLLKEDSTHLTVGTAVTIKKLHEISNNVFQPYSNNIEVTMHVYFVIPLNAQFYKLEEFKEVNVPTLVLTKEVLHGKDESISIKEYLDDFVDRKFINNSS